MSCPRCDCRIDVCYATPAGNQIQWLCPTCHHEWEGSRYSLSVIVNGHYGIALIDNVEQTDPPTKIRISTMLGVLHAGYGIVVNGNGYVLLDAPGHTCDLGGVERGARGCALTGAASGKTRARGTNGHVLNRRRSNSRCPTTTTTTSPPPTTWSQPRAASPSSASTRPVPIQTVPVPARLAG